MKFILSLFSLIIFAVSYSNQIWIDNSSTDLFLFADPTKVRPLKNPTYFQFNGEVTVEGWECYCWEYYPIGLSHIESEKSLSCNDSILKKVVQYEIFLTYVDCEFAIDYQFR